MQIPLFPLNVVLFPEGELKLRIFEPRYIDMVSDCLRNDTGFGVCFIQEDNTLQPFTKIGNNVVMWAGNHIGHHSTIHDHVFFTSHVVLSGHCDVGAFSWFGVNSTIRDYTKIGNGTFVAAGALITKDTTQWRGYLGSPAKEFKDSLELNP